MLQGELSLKVTVFEKLLTLNVREEFEWYLRYQSWYRDVENLGALFQIGAKPEKIYFFPARPDCFIVNLTHFFLAPTAW